MNYSVIFQVYIEKNILFIEYFKNSKSYIFIINLSNLKNKYFEFNCNGYKTTVSNLIWNLENDIMFPMEIRLYVRYFKKKISNNLIFNKIINYLLKIDFFFIKKIFGHIL
jgi:hypothetical protein